MTSQTWCYCFTEDAVSEVASTSIFRLCLFLLLLSRIGSELSSSSKCAFGWQWPAVHGFLRSQAAAQNHSVVCMKRPSGWHAKPVCTMYHRWLLGNSRACNCSACQENFWHEWRLDFDFLKNGDYSHKYQIQINFMQEHKTFFFSQ